MSISIFELFSIGIGPSSSHTVGPMRAAHAFVEQLRAHSLTPTRLEVCLYGSLALTGVGHGTDLAILNGLAGYDPQTVEPTTMHTHAQHIRAKKQIENGNFRFDFDPSTDLKFLQKEVLPKHSNGMRFNAFAQGSLLFSQVYYSIGGGFIVLDEDYGKEINTVIQPYPFSTAHELFSQCAQHQLSVAQLMLANELVWRDEKEVIAQLLNIAGIMRNCIEAGYTSKEKTLPGKLQVKRRAPAIYRKLQSLPPPSPDAQGDMMNWLNLYAMAVNEENASGGRVVTAPTNGAAGIIPSVLNYYRNFHNHVTDLKIADFLLTAGAIAILYKKGASISGAEVGCQGEVGVACSMAAGALTAVLGGNLEQVENAAEIAMEHHLGMTCDPIGGLVQIPCIERNAMGAVKAVNATRIALMEEGKNKIPLDKVIATMRQTGHDMMTIYKETSLGGLAVNIPEC